MICSCAVEVISNKVFFTVLTENTVGGVSDLTWQRTKYFTCKCPQSYQNKPVLQEEPCN